LPLVICGICTAKTEVCHANSSPGPSEAPVDLLPLSDNSFSYLEFWPLD